MVPNETSKTQEVEQTSKANSSRQAKENAARKGITRPPLNFLAILKDANISIDTSSPDELCKELYAGIYLKPNTLENLISVGVKSRSIGDGPERRRHVVKRLKWLS